MTGIVNRSHCRAKCLPNAVGVGGRGPPPYSFSSRSMWREARSQRALGITRILLRRRLAALQPVDDVHGSRFPTGLAGSDVLRQSSQVSRRRRSVCERMRVGVRGIARLCRGVDISIHLHHARGFRCIAGIYR